MKNHIIINVEVNVEQREGSFFDPKTIMAIVLVGAVWIGWQSYLTKKYPDYNKPKTAVNQTVPTASVEQANSDAGKNGTDTKAMAASPTAASGSTPVAAANLKESLVSFDNEVATFEVSSKGMGFKTVTLKKFKDRSNSLVKLGEGESFGLFELQYSGSPVSFEMSPVSKLENGNSQIVGLAQIGQMKIKRSFEFNTGYIVKSEIAVENAPSDFKGFQVVIREKVTDSKPGSIFAPATDIQEFVFGTGKTFERLNTLSKEGIDKVAGLFDVAAVSSHYFVSGFANQSDIVPEVSVRSKLNDKEVAISSWFKPTNIAQAMIFPSVLFTGPKDLDLLQEASSSRVDFTPLVNFGFFGAIGKILLKILQFFHDYTIANWGLAIIFLTLLVRILVLPFNLASYKSMRKMALIQPQIQSLRERYKDDQQTLNVEMMKLMKTQKVNPVGGCLPMLLQMPVFFALYQVLGQSIELYQAPFFGWIQDLSLKDPYFVLPILMGVSMWYNQKITPSTMDPAQAKVMQFLPIVFSLMMIALPSGLTLYIFISTLFGIIQQQIFMKDRNKTAKLAVIN